MQWLSERNFEIPQYHPKPTFSAWAQMSLPENWEQLPTIYHFPRPWWI